MSRFECSFAEPNTIFSFASKAKAPQCDAICLQDSDDVVLTAAETPEIDTERFCFYECEPRPPRGKTPRNGDLCGPLSRAEAHQVRDGTGNALPPMQRPKLATAHFLAHRVRHATAARLTLAAPAPAPAPGPAPGPMTPWESVKEPSPDLSAKLTEWAQDANSSAAAAEDDASKVEDMAEKAGNQMAAAMATVEKAREAAEDAHQDELKVRAMRDNALFLAREAAFTMIKPTVKTVMKEARKKAKKVAVEKGKKLKQSMLKQVPEASAKAMQPYKDAMNRAAAMATDYSNSGNDLTSQSASLQMQAQVAGGSANQYIAVGDVPKGQKLMQQSQMLMKLATGLNSQASKFFNTAESITGTLGAYAKEAEAAAYHATLMLNPDAPPPPPPLVLAQEEEGHVVTGVRSPHRS